MEFQHRLEIGSYGSVLMLYSKRPKTVKSIFFLVVNWGLPAIVVPCFIWLVTAPDTESEFYFTCALIMAWGFIFHEHRKKYVALERAVLLNEIAHVRAMIIAEKRRLADKLAVKEGWDIEDYSDLDEHWVKARKSQDGKSEWVELDNLHSRRLEWLQLEIAELESGKREPVRYKDLSIPPIHTPNFFRVTDQSD